MSGQIFAYIGTLSAIQHDATGPARRRHPMAWKDKVLLLILLQMIVGPKTLSFDDNLTIIIMEVVTDVQLSA